MRRRPVFQKIMTEALRMLDVPKDIPEEFLAIKKPAKEKPGEFAGDLAIADLGGPSIMEEDPSVRQLLAEQTETGERTPTKSPRRIERRRSAALRSRQAGDSSAQRGRSTRRVTAQVPAPRFRISAANRCAMWWKNPPRAALT